MEKNAINVEGMPKGGPYSHAVEAGGLLFLSGQVPFDPEKNLAIKDDIKAATKLILTNIGKLLEHCGSSLDKVIKATVFLRDMGYFGDMNEVYAEFFTNDPPARSCVAVRELPGDYPIEIEVIAIK